LKKTAFIIFLVIVIGILMAIIFGTKSDFVLEDRVDDTVADVRELLKLPTDSVHVLIRYVDRELIDGSVITYAWVIGDPENHQYIINLTKRVTRYNVAEIIAHEMVHIKQYEDGSLRIDPEHLHVIHFRGNAYNVNYTPYNLRPWEAEAFVMSSMLEFQLKQ
jgi:hypothetical protein